MRILSFFILAPISFSAMAQDIPATRPTSAANAFNPAIGVILNGTYGHFSRDPASYSIPGFVAAEETGPGTAGLSLGESELVMSANADDLFYSNLTVALTPENEASVEEAYIRTIGAPYGATIKAGRFFSGIGYLNEQHPHAWDFVDAPLPYRALLGNQYGDDGVQVRWLAPTDLFLEFGAEGLRGDAFPGAGAAHQGSGAYTAFVHVGGDIGVSHSWRAGISHLRAQAIGRENTDVLTDDLIRFSGESRVSIADLVWKWAPNGNATARNFKLQGEYFRRDEAGDYKIDDVNGAPVLAETPYDRAQSGWYLQAIYQFMPRWRTGVRYDALHAQAVPTSFAGTALDPANHDPRRAGVMIDFSNSEFTRLRVQYNRDQSRPETDHQFFLQYIASIGAHGAHRF